MALVVICGQPCSGKTGIAEALATNFREQGSTVVVVDEPSLSLERNASYQGDSHGPS
jgi:protein KTI12